MGRIVKVFPARAGMSLSGYAGRPHQRGVPRASGDEPAGKLFLAYWTRCSPRERG